MNIQLKKIPFLSRARRWRGEGSRHQTSVNTYVLLVLRWFGQVPVPAIQGIIDR